jgi:hypothetical protein
LHSIANAEDRLLQVEGILEEKFVGSFAERIGWGGAGIEGLAKLFRIYIGMAARQQDALGGGNEASLLLLAGVERHGDWNAARLFDRSGVLRPAALVVFGVGGGGFGDEDAWF